MTATEHDIAKARCIRCGYPKARIIESYRDSHKDIISAVYECCLCSKRYTQGEVNASNYADVDKHLQRGQLAPAPKSTVTANAAHPVTIGDLQIRCGNATVNWLSAPYPRWYPGNIITAAQLNTSR